MAAFRHSAIRLIHSERLTRMFYGWVHASQPKYHQGRKTLSLVDGQS